MPTFVMVEKCDGCKGRERTVCQYICPNDLMLLNKETMRAYNQEPDACWECFNCVKYCPQQAIEARGYADFVPLGPKVIPLRGTDSIMWTVIFRDGEIKRFKFPTRTTPEGSIQPYEGFPGPGTQDLKTRFLSTGPKPVSLEEAGSRAKK